MIRAPLYKGEEGHPFPGALALKKQGCRLVWDLRNLEVNTGIVEAVLPIGAWTTGVITLLRGGGSPHGSAFSALQTAVTLAADSLSIRINLAGIALLAAEVTVPSADDVYPFLTLSAMLDPGAAI